MKIQYLGFIPAVIFAGFLIWAFIGLFKEDEEFRVAVSFIFSLIIAVLGFIWALS